MSNLIGSSTGTSSFSSYSCVYYLIFVSNATFINFVPFFLVNFGSVFSSHTVLSLSATSSLFMILWPSVSNFSHCFLACSLNWPSPDIFFVFAASFLLNLIVTLFSLYCVLCSCYFTLIVVCALVVNLCVLVLNFSWTNLFEQFAVIAIVCG